MIVVPIFLLAVITPPGSGSGQVVGPGQPLVRAIHDAYVANQSSFRFGVLKFEHVRGVADDGEAARAGEFDPRNSLIGHYAFLGEEARIDLVFPEETMRKATRFLEGDTVQTTLGSFRVMTNGEVTVSDALDVKRTGPGFSHTPRMVDGKDTFLGSFEFPLSLGQPGGPQFDNLGPRLSEVLAGSPDYAVAELEPAVEFEGRGVVKISVTSPPGREDYWVDLERGAVPLKVEYRFKDGEELKWGCVVFNDNLKRFPNQGWLPMRRSWCYGGAGEAGHYVILEADFETPPPRPALGLEFDEPVGLRNETAMISYPPRKFWDLKTLPSPGSPEVRRSPPPPIPLDQVPQHPGERPSPGNTRLVLLGAFAILILAAVGLWLRRSRE